VNRHDTHRRLLARCDELKGREAERLRAHLLVCDACRELARGYDVQDAMLRPLGQIRPPPALRDAVLASIDRREETNKEPRHTPPAGRLRTWFLGGVVAASVVIAGAFGATSLLDRGSPPSVQMALAKKGYTLLFSRAPAPIGRNVAKQIALAFFPGRVSGVRLARVLNGRAPAFGPGGRLCWMISIVPPDGPLLTQPGNTWLDAASAQGRALPRTGYLVVFVDAKRGTFVLASSADSA
jgi:hypothetical protein